MYWLVSLPPSPAGSAEDSWHALEECAQAGGTNLARNRRFVVPAFNVGTLDALLDLSDDLVKVNASVEGTVNKLRRQLFELASAAPAGPREDSRDRGGGAGERASLLESRRQQQQQGSRRAGEARVEDRTPRDYLESFAWQEAKYPSRRALKDTVKAIVETTARLDDDLKRRAAEHGALRNAASAAGRRGGGSLAVRDVSAMVPASQVVESENLLTLLVVVSRTQRAEFLAGYERLSDFVVPRSARSVAAEGEHELFAVVVFKRTADGFRAAAREKGLVVRDACADPSVQEAAQAQAARAAGELERSRAALEEWSARAYGEAFSAWIHVLAVRLFVESVLRYGLPPLFMPVLVRPSPKGAAHLRKALAKRFKSAGSDHWVGGESAAGEAETFPYVSFSLDIEEHM